MKRRCIIVVNLLLFALTANAQSDCYFKVDKERVMYNEHLEYFVKKLQKDTFILSTDKHQLPDYVQKQLYCIFKDTIANANEEYQAGCIVTEPLPWRRLNFFARSKNTFLINYIKGGFGTWTGVIIMEFAKQGITVNNEPKLIAIWMNQDSFPQTFEKTVEHLRIYRNINNGSVIDLSDFTPK